jgi:pimeloyl-ACP methyl ester carboxylesterase
MVASKDGTPIACWVTGITGGLPLVLVHGTTGDHNSNVLLTPLLESAFTVWSVDRRGRGSSGDAAPYSIEREYEDIAAVVDAAGASGQDAALFGHSFGADVALGAALLSKHLSQLILYEPSAGMESPTEEQLSQLDALAAQGKREELLETLLRRLSGMSDAQVAAFKATPFWEMRLGAVHTSPRELRAVSELAFDPQSFVSMKTPAMVLLGSESPEWAKRGAEAVAAGLPNARLEILEGQGHSANFTAPDLLARKMSEFLAD